MSVSSVWHSEQQVTQLNAPWTKWGSLGTVPGRISSLVVVPNHDGRLHAFVGSDDQVWHSEQQVTQLNAPWTGWSPLASLPASISSLVVLPNHEGKLQVFGDNGA